jgi:hypothetical protein
MGRWKTRQGQGMPGGVQITKNADGTFETLGRDDEAMASLGYLPAHGSPASVAAASAGATGGSAAPAKTGAAPSNRLRAAVIETLTLFGLTVPQGASDDALAAALNSTMAKAHAAASATGASGASGLTGAAPAVHAKEPVPSAGGARPNIQGQPAHASGASGASGATGASEDTTGPTGVTGPTGSTGA